MNSKLKHSPADFNAASKLPQVMVIGKQTNPSKNTSPSRANLHVANHHDQEVDE